MSNDRALFTSEVILSVVENPENPPVGSFTVFPKPNGKLYMKNSNGFEYPVGDVPGNAADVETDGTALQNQIGVWLDNETLQGFVGFTYEPELTKLSVPQATGTIAIGGTDVIKAESGTIQMRNIGFIDPNTALSIKNALSLEFTDIGGLLNVNQIDAGGVLGANYFLAGDGEWKEVSVLGDPVGTIQMYVGSVDPADNTSWLLCDGRSLLHTEDVGQGPAPTEYYPLYQIIGTTYGGSGDNFNLPDLGGRVPIGVNNNFALASQGGVEEITLTVNEMPAHSHVTQPHNHTINDPGHTHGVNGSFLQGGDDNNYRLTQWDGGRSTDVGYTGVSINSSSIAVENTGGGLPHTNLPPYQAVNYIIKAK